jgi:sugar O-acyltransferase (sialic acid O-acetyltransferase NeuD family)
MTRTVLIGGGGHARVVASLLRKLGSHDLVGYTALAEGPTTLGMPYLGDDGALEGLVAAGRVDAAALGIGIVRVGEARGALRRRLGACGLALPALVSPHAVVDEDVALMPGAVVMDGAIVHPGTRVGAGTIVNTHATIEHDCAVGDDCHVAPGAVLCGGVSVGAGSIIGANACVLPGVRIHEDCLVAAGATVVADLERPGTYVGCPARLRAE